MGRSIVAFKCSVKPFDDLFEWTELFRYRIVISETNHLAGIKTNALLIHFFWQTCYSLIHIFQLFDEQGLQSNTLGLRTVHTDKIFHCGL